MKHYPVHETHSRGAPGTALELFETSLEGVNAVADSQWLAGELSVWLRALRSFFHLRNQPSRESDLDEIHRRNFRWEAHIARQTLLHSIYLTNNLAKIGIADASTSVDAGSRDRQFISPGSITGADSLNISQQALRDLAESLTDLCSMEPLMGTDYAGLAAWSSLGRVLRRQVESSEAGSALMQFSGTPSDHLKSLFDRLTRPLVPDSYSVDMLRVFSSFANLLHELTFVEQILKQGSRLERSLPLFTLVHEGGLALEEFLLTRAMRTPDLPDEAFDALDSTGYAVGMELRKVFSHELTGLGPKATAGELYTATENAHGLLRDCFQQCTFALAKMIDSTLEEQSLFQNYHTRLGQSLLLRDQLWSLIESVRLAQRTPEPFAISSLIGKVDAFRQLTLRHLMHKDWDAYETFAEELHSAREEVEIASVLHRFSTYLTALFRMVNMRAVLRRHPFIHPVQGS